MIRRVMLCYAMLCHVMLCHVIIRRAKLYYVVTILFNLFNTIQAKFNRILQLLSIITYFFITSNFFFFFLFFLGNPQGSHTVRTARELILDNFNNRNKDKDKQENENNEKDSDKKKGKGKSGSGFKTQDEKDGKKVIDIGDNQTVTFYAKSENEPVKKATSTSEKMMMVRRKEYQMNLWYNCVTLLLHDVIY